MANNKSPYSRVLIGNDTDKTHERIWLRGNAQEVVVMIQDAGVEVFTDRPKSESTLAAEKEAEAVKQRKADRLAAKELREKEAEEKKVARAQAKADKAAAAESLAQERAEKKAKMAEEKAQLAKEAADKAALAVAEALNPTPKKPKTKKPSGKKAKGKKKKSK